MPKFNDSKGEVLISKEIVIEELKKIVAPFADLQIDDVVEEMLGTLPYEYSITFPVTFSNFDYPKMQEYGFTDDKLRKELSENISKNLYDGVMAIILNGETKATDEHINNGYALNYSINKSHESSSDEDKVTNINVEDGDKYEAVHDILKYHIDTFRKLYGVNPSRALLLGMQDNTMRVFGLDPTKKESVETTSVVDGVSIDIKTYEVHRNDYGLMYLASDTDELPFIVRLMCVEDTDEFRIAVYKKDTTKVLYCKLYE